MDQWLSHEMLFWISIGSGIALALGVIAVPWIVVKLPQDSFSNTRRKSWLDQKPVAVRIPIRIAKNLLGVLLIVLGIAMLVLPGQGILSILLGVMLMDFPGKTKFQQWIVARPKVMGTLNWFRRKWKRPPLQQPAKMAA